MNSTRRTRARRCWRCRSRTCGSTCLSAGAWLPLVFYSPVLSPDVEVRHARTACACVDQLSALSLPAALLLLSHSPFSGHVSVWQARRGLQADGREAAQGSARAALQGRCANDHSATRCATSSSPCSSSHHQFSCCASDLLPACWPPHSMILCRARMLTVAVECCCGRAAAAEGEQDPCDPPDQPRL